MSDNDSRARRAGILTRRFGSGAGSYLARGQLCCEPRCTEPAAYYRFLLNGGAGIGYWTCAEHKLPGAIPLPDFPEDVRRELLAAGALPGDAR